MSTIKVFSGSSNPEFVHKVCDYLGEKPGAIIRKKFSDGETFIKLGENIRGADVFLVQSTSYPTNDHIMELLLMIDACQRASAGRITAVIPYYGYARQDRKSEPRVPISAKVLANLIETIGVDRVLTMDLHADQIQGFFDIPVDHLYGSAVFIEYARKLNIPDLTVVSPDAGGSERARFIAKRLDATLALIDKRRPMANVAEVMNVIGDVHGRNVLIVDDMIDTAGTITKAIYALKEKGALDAYVFASHAVLSGAGIDRLKEMPVKQMFFTDSIKHPRLEELTNVTIMSVAGLFGEAIRRIHHDESVNALFLE